MLTKDELTAKLAEINEKVDISLKNCKAFEQQLDQMRANHNAMLGAQMLARELVEEAEKKADV